MSPNTKPDWVREAIEEAHQEVTALPDTRRALLEHLIADISEGIMVLHSRDGLPVTQAIARERARNVVCVMIHSPYYRIEALS